MLINNIYRTDKKIPFTKTNLQKKVKKVLKYLYKKNFNKINLDIVFVDNNEIRLLNKKFLKKYEYTDVLCFNYDTYNGEIIISIEQVSNQAKLFGNSVKKELIFVLVHGILHFKGKTDYTKKDKKNMLNYGTKIINKLNLCST